MDQNVGGLQLALFELIWPAYPWINWIRLVDHPATPALYIQPLSTQDSSEKEACLASLKEVLELWRPGCAPSVHFQLPSGDFGSSIEIMSASTFAEIAAEVAPWRLELGR